MTHAMKLARAHVEGIRQETQYTCMAASLAACAKVHGKPVTERDVNAVLGAAPLRGARWEEALATIQYFGLRGCLVVPSTLDMLRDWTSRGIPVVVAYNPENRPWSHASVVVEVDEEDYVHVMDPNIPDHDEHFRVIHKSEFFKMWGEPVGNSLIVRRPALAVTLEIDADGQPADIHAIKLATSGTMNKSAGKKERQQAKDRKRSLKMKMKDKSDEKLTDSQKRERRVKRQQAIEDGSYWSSGSGMHKDKSKYDRKKEKNWKESAMNPVVKLFKDLEREFKKRGWGPFSTSEDGYLSVLTVGSTEYDDSYFYVTVYEDEGDYPWSADLGNREESGDGFPSKKEILKAVDQVSRGWAGPSSFRMAGLMTLEDFENRLARYEEGKPADPTENMSPEEAEEWEANTEKYKDKFKTAMDSYAFGHASKTIHVKGWVPDEGITVDGKLFGRIEDAREHIEKVISRYHEVIVLGPEFSLGPNSQAVPYGDPPYVVRSRRNMEIDTGYDSLSLFNKHWDKVMGWGRYMKASAGLSLAELDDALARYEKDKPADPTENMSPEEAEEWEANTEKYKDKFKSATMTLAEFDEACGCGGGSDEDVDTDSEDYEQGQGYVIEDDPTETHVFDQGFEGARALYQLEQALDEEISGLDWEMEGTPYDVHAITIVGSSSIAKKANRILSKATKKRR